MALTIYLWLSTMLLGFIASVWSSKVGINILIKVAFIGTAILGCVLIAKTVLP